MVASRSRARSGIGLSLKSAGHNLELAGETADCKKALHWLRLASRSLALVACDAATSGIGRKQRQRWQRLATKERAEYERFSKTCMR